MGVACRALNAHYFDSLVPPSLLKKIRVISFLLVFTLHLLLEYMVIQVPLLKLFPIFRRFEWIHCARLLWYVWLLGFVSIYFATKVKTIGFGHEGLLGVTSAILESLTHVAPSTPYNATVWEKLLILLQLTSRCDWCWRYIKMSLAHSVIVSNSVPTSWHYSVWVWEIRHLNRELDDIYICIASWLHSFSLREKQIIHFDFL